MLVVYTSYCWQASGMVLFFHNLQDCLNYQYSDSLCDKLLGNNEQLNWPLVLLLIILIVVAPA